MTASRSFRWLCGFLFVLLATGVALVLPLPAQGAAASWTGTWETRWRGGGAILHLRQAGTNVTGSYPLFEGAVTGSIEGSRLTGRWTEASGRTGAFLFSLAKDGESFMGRFDSGEWWTGNRLSGTDEFVPTPADLSSPRATLRSLLEAANGARDGLIERIRPALDTIDFSNPGLRSEKVLGSPLLPGERIQYVRLLFSVLDELTFRVWDLPGPDLPGPMGPTEVAVSLGQAGTTNTFELGFVRRGGSWLIDPPPRARLDEVLVRLSRRWGGRLRTGRDHLLLGNPRDAFRTFVEEMERLDFGGVSNVLRTLDLDHLTGPIQKEDALLMAQYLRQVIHRIGVVLFQEIPDDPGQREPYVFFRHGAGDIVIAPYPSGEGGTRWRFTADTLHRLRNLYAAIETMPEAMGIAGGLPASGYFAIRETLRSGVPWLLFRAGPIEIWQWLSLLILGLVSVLTARLLGRLVLWILTRRSSWAAALAARPTRAKLIWPLRCTFVGLFWALGIGSLGLPENVSGPLRSLTETLAIGGGAWLVHAGFGIANRYSMRAVGTTGRRAVFTSLAFGILRLLVLLAGVLLMARAWSVPYGGVLAGFGIGGLAFALAAQPTLQNMIGGFTLLADSPLSVGDFCRYGDKVGTVEEIGLRSTRIRSLDRTLISIPNSEFSNLQLENFAKRDRILLRTEVQLRYETTPDQLRFVLAELRRLLIAHPRIHPDPARVRFVGFGAHSLDLEVFAYVVTSEYGEFLAVREDVYLRFMEIVLRSGTGFAFPSQVNYLARDTGLDPAATKEAEETVARWRASNNLPFPEFSAAEIRRLDGRMEYPPQGSPAAGEQRG